MRVLMTAPPLSKQGGVANYCRVVHPHFKKDVRLVTRGSRLNSRAKTWSPQLFSRLVRDYRDLIRAFLAGCDLVHQNTSLGLEGMLRDIVVILLAKLFRTRLVIFFHGWQEDMDIRLSTPLYKPLLRFYLSADSVIVLAERFKERVLAWGFAGPIYIETTPVNDEDLAGVNLDGEATDPKADTTRPFHVLFFARIEEDKGIYCTLDAVHKLQKSGYRVRLTVAGDGSAREAAEQYVHQQGIQDIIFVGYVSGPDKARTLSEADVYMLPTTHGEGLPTTVLEAMAFGLPVITRPVGGIPDVVKDSIHGFLTERTDAEAFAELLERFVQNRELLAQMSEANRAYARQRFMASQVARRLESIYEQALADQPESIGASF